MDKTSNALSLLFNQDKGNVLVVGNSGVGKSTLINAVLGESCTVTGHQPKGVTTMLNIYENDYLPFRLIDTVGFEEGKKQSKDAIKAIHKWIKESAKKSDMDKVVNEIWFCVDGTSSRLFLETIKKFEKSISIWENVPVIIVVTKSYSNIERENNIDMVNAALNEYKNQLNVKKIIPVVAKHYQINEEVNVLPDGIDELVKETIALMPIGKKHAKEGIAKFQAFANRRKAMASISGFAVAAVGNGLAKTPFEVKMAALYAIEKKELVQIAKIYGTNEQSKEVQELLEYILDKGFVAKVGTAMAAIMAKLPAVGGKKEFVKSAVTAGLVVALGAAEMYIFEQIATGKKSRDDVTWAKQILEERVTVKFTKQMQGAFKKIIEGKKAQKKMTPAVIVGVLIETFFDDEDKSKKEKKDSRKKKKTS